MATTAISPSKRATGAAGGMSSVASVTAQQMRAGGPATPLDYSFMGLATLSDMLLHDPVSGYKKSETESSTARDGDTSSGSGGKPPLAGAPVSLRVNNNKLTNLDDMEDALSAVFHDPSKLQLLL